MESEDARTGKGLRSLRKSRDSIRGEYPIPSSGTVNFLSSQEILDYRDETGVPSS